MKKRHIYQISIDHVKNADGTSAEDEKIEFEFASHDELFGIIQQLKTRADIKTENAAPLALGIKLFGGIMLENKSKPMFADLFPHFAAFMKNLKQNKTQ